MNGQISEVYANGGQSKVIIREPSDHFQSDRKHEKQPARKCTKAHFRKPKGRFSKSQREVEAISAQIWRGKSPRKV